MITRPILALFLLLALVVFALLARWIAKLPNKYERRPRILNPWSALDSGIDPSDVKRSLE